MDNPLYMDDDDDDDDEYIMRNEQWVMSNG